MSYGGALRFASRIVTCLVGAFVACLVVTTPLIAQQIAADDPTRDGWQTEAFAVIAARQLDRLSELARNGESASALMHEQFTGVFPTTAERRDVPPFELETWGEPQAPQGAEPFVNWLRNRWHRIENCSTHFKIVGIRPRKSYVETDVLVEAAGMDGGRAWEEHATWRVSWTPSNTGHASLKAISIQNLRVSRTQQERSARFFNDDTVTVMGSSTSYLQQLRFGQRHWLRRIEAFHGMLNPGQQGIAVGDLNGDGRDDLIVCQPGGLPNLAYVQQADGTVRDITLDAGIGILDNTHSALIIDLDNDRDQDIIFATASALLVFENRAQRFVLRHANREMSDAYSLAANDFDKDGDLDIFACGYFPNGADVHALPIPIPYFDAKNGGANRLLRNDGEFKFADVTETVGLNANNRRFSYAAIWIDLDNDSLDDLYVANDFGPDCVYRCTQTKGSDASVRFVDVSKQLKLQHGAFGMSAAATDVDHDGFEDVYVANMYSSAGNRVTRQSQFRPSASLDNRQTFQRLANGNSLLLNRGGKRFEDVGPVSGTAMGRWSWGGNFADINNDGWDDLLVTNGYISGETTTDL